jgi:ribonucleoside-triphosphate reductase
MDSFIEPYKTRDVNWGFQDAGGNSIGELTFIRTYSRVKPDGTKEKWWEVCLRVINGMYSIQKDWCKANSLPWNDRKAHASAQEAFERLFEFKWTPPGRGLWMMGTEFVMRGKDGKKNGSALQNCAVVSTGDIDKHDPGALFYWVMDALMLGVGVGWDTLGENKNIEIVNPNDDKVEYIIEDSREGWADSVRVLINSYMKPNGKRVVFDYSLIRPYGEPIKGFGGTASGPAPLVKVHEQIAGVLQSRVGQALDSELIADLMNLIGTCVVAGNVRRSAELGLGRADDEKFVNLKNPEMFPVRNSHDPANPGWAWMSNNSLAVEVGQDYMPFVERIASNGEPGFAWLDMARNYGRLIDGPTDYDDGKVVGFNPCAEQQLESYEMCTLVELHVNRAESLDDFLRTVKFAYLYGKTVTLLSTHWEKTNAVMQKNRRIGLSITGMAGFVDDNGLPQMRDWWNNGYARVKSYDKQYSEWLGVRESKRSTSVKPSGSVSLLSGATPGVHWPSGGAYYMRAIRLSDSSPMVQEFIDAGYKVEDDLVSANTVVVYFPVKAGVKRGEHEVTIFEKIALAAEAQKYWADNSVSVTVTFNKDTEAQFIDTVLNMYEGQLKTVSFLPMGNDVYPQQPYTSITEDEYSEWIGKLGKINTSAMYGDATEAAGDRYCSTDSCELKIEK